MLCGYYPRNGKPVSAAHQAPHGIRPDTAQPRVRFVGELPQDRVDFTGLGETGSYQRVYTFEDEYTKKTKAVRGPSVGVKKPVSGKTSNSYQVGMRVSHLTFGQGTILSMMPMSGDTLLEIAFDTKGTKKVMANYAKLTIL